MIPTGPRLPTAPHKPELLRGRSVVHLTLISHLSWLAYSKLAFQLLTAVQSPIAADFSCECHCVCVCVCVRAFVGVWACVSIGECVCGCIYGTDL